MCRNIKTLYNLAPAATEAEMQASALQYVRKVSGYRQPSQLNEAAFAQAVAEISQATRRLLAALETSAPPRDREQMAAQAKARAAGRYRQE